MRLSARSAPNLFDHHLLTRQQAGVACLLVLLWLPRPALADEAGSDTASAPLPSHTMGFWDRDVLTGDWGGERTALEDSGITLGAATVDETFGNVSGGTRQGAIYDGRLELLATVDLEKTVGWTGATFFADAYQIRGRGLSQNNLGGNFFTVSDIEADRAFRLSDAWIEVLLPDSKGSIRFGDIAADDEFFISQYSANFINATTGWPAIMSAALPSGGPAYPLATPGFRLRYTPDEAVSFLLGVFNGDPVGAGPGDPQSRSPSGTSFRTQDGSFVIGEATHQITDSGSGVGYRSAYKLGAWFHTGFFPDQRFDTAGLSLASPQSTGVPARRRYDYGVYGIVDQALWRRSDTTDEGLSAYLRLAGAPADRNEIAFYVDGGLAFKGPVPDRADDIVGIGGTFAKISARATALDEDQRRFSGIDIPLRDHETLIELFYRLQLTPWWIVEPDLQFIFHPGGNVAIPGGDPTVPIKNATIVGVRSSIVF